MRTAVFGDVHGNLIALETMLRHAGKVDRYVCLGDVVNYGPWSDECVDLIELLPSCDRLVGNHDRAFITGLYPGTHPVAKMFFEHCFPSFVRREPLTRYQEQCFVGRFCAKHTLFDQYIFCDTPINLDQDYIIAHSHRQFRIESQSYLLYNSGSVGQNREYINIINYLICDSDASNVQMISIPYNVDMVIDEMRRLHYPKLCIKYYENKPRA